MDVTTTATESTRTRLHHGGVAPDVTWDLVDRAREGDSEAFTILYERHVKLVEGFLYARSSNWSLTEDLTSETFVRALSRLGYLTHRRSSFGAWLITIARNLLLDHRKSAHHRHEVPLPEWWDTADSSMDPAHAFERSHEAGLLRRHLDELTFDQRECLVLRFFLGLTVAEVAEKMHRTPGSVRALQLRATNRLASLVLTGR